MVNKYRNHKNSLTIHNLTDTFFCNVVTASVSIFNEVTHNVWMSESFLCTFHTEINVKCILSINLNILILHEQNCIWVIRWWCKKCKWFNQYNVKEVQMTDEVLMRFKECIKKLLQTHWQTLKKKLKNEWCEKERKILKERLNVLCWIYWKITHALTCSTTIIDWWIVNL